MARLSLLAASIALLFVPAPDAAPSKGDGPNQIATGYGSVWIGTGGGSVIRIDPRRYRIVQRHDVSFTSVYDLVPAYGAMWAATGSGLLQRIDARSGRVRECWTRNACSSRSVAVAGGAVWVLDFHHKRLCRIDPGRNRVIRRVWIDVGEPLIMWSDARRLWLATNVDPKPPLVEENLEHVRLIALDPRTGTPLGTTVETSGWVAFSSGFGSLWGSDPIADKLTRVDATTGRTLVVRAGISGAGAPAAGFRALWLPLGDRLARLDPESLEQVAEVPVAADDVAVGAGGVWVLDTGDGTRGVVRKVDPQTNRVVGPAIAVG